MPDVGQYKITNYATTEDEDDPPVVLGYFATKEEVITRIEKGLGADEPEFALDDLVVEVLLQDGWWFVPATLELVLGEPHHKIEEPIDFENIPIIILLEDDEDEEETE